MSEKVAYARRFQPYDWLIGSGEYLNNVEADMQKQGLKCWRACASATTAATS